MEIIDWIALINAVVTLFVIFWIRFYPTNRSLQAEVRELDVSLKDMTVSFEATIDDLYDLMDTYIKKWSNRQDTRSLRAREKDLKSQEPIEKSSGIVPLSQIKTYGTNKQDKRGRRSDQE